MTISNARTWLSLKLISSLNIAIARTERRRMVAVAVVLAQSETVGVDRTIS